MRGEHDILLFLEARVLAGVRVDLLHDVAQRHGGVVRLVNLREATRDMCLVLSEWLVRAYNGGGERQHMVFLVVSVSLGRVNDGGSRA